MSNENNYNENNSSQINNSFYSSNPEPPAKKKRKWPIAAGIAGAAVLAGGTAAWWFFLRTPSFDNPTEAVTACMAQLGDQFSSENLETGLLEKQLDRSSMLETISKDGSVFDLSLTLNDSNISALSAVNGITVGLTLENDIPDNILGGNITAYLYGMGGDIGFYTDSKEYAVNSEEFLPDSYLSLKKEDFIKALVSDMDEEQSSQLNAALNEQAPNTLAGLTEYSEYATGHIPDSLISFAGDCDIEKNDHKNSVKINDTKYKCYTYDVTISAKAFKAFAQEYTSYLADYNYEDNDFFSTLGQFYRIQSSDETPLCDVIRNKLEEIPDSIDDSTKMELELYISKNCELLGIQTNNPDSGDLTILFGGEHPGQEIYFTYAEPEGTNCILSIASSSTDSMDIDTFEFSYESDDDTSVNLEAENIYTVDDESFQTDISLSTQGSGTDIKAKIKADGVYNNIEEGKRYTIVFDNLNVSADAGNKNYSLELSGSMTIGALDEKIPKPSGKKYDVLNLSDEDVTTILKQLKSNTLLSLLLSDVTEEDITNFINGIINK